MIAWFGKIMLVDQEEISANAYNPRLNEEKVNVIRGAILDSAGDSLAYTEVLDDGSQQRIYPYGEVFAHVTGYVGRGMAGLELAANDTLLKAPDFLDTLQSWANEEAVQGSNIRTTLNSSLQQFVYERFSGYKGAVVITDPSTGKVRVLMSSPSYDPADVIDNWDNIAANEDSPLYARATQGLYPPGSTFKLITALAMMRAMPDYENYTYVCDGSYEVGNNSISCAGGAVHGYMTLEDAFAYSCNGYFASAAVQMGGDALRETAEYLNISESFDFILPQSESSVVVSSEYEADSMVAQTGIGQGETQMTPFYLNMLTCSIANGGVLYTPYLIDQTIDASGAVEKTLPKLWGTMMSAAEATYLENLMTGVVQYGTASSLYHEGVSIYGKTGTAQIDGGEDHSWFTGYTKVNGQVDLAITVLVENGGSEKRAAPIVQQIIDYYYS